MLCPICKTASLIVKKGHYFCTRCRIYTRKVDKELTPLMPSKESQFASLLNNPFFTGEAKKEIIEDIQTAGEASKSSGSFIKSLLIIIILIFLVLITATIFLALKK